MGVPGFLFAASAEEPKAMDVSCSIAHGTISLEATGNLS